MPPFVHLSATHPTVFHHHHHHQGRRSKTQKIMEGLIPYVYRAIRRRRTRRYYKCLSSGSNQRLISPSFRAAAGPKFPPPAPEAQRVFPGESAGHRRHRSMEDFPGELSPDGFPERRRLGKGSGFSSSRMFSCIAGA